MPHSWQAEKEAHVRLNKHRDLETLCETIQKMVSSLSCTFSICSIFWLGISISHLLLCQLSWCFPVSLPCGKAIQKGEYSFFGQDDQTPLPSMDAQNLIKALLKVDPRKWLGRTCHGHQESSQMITFWANSCWSWWSCVADNSCRSFEWTFIA